MTQHSKAQPAAGPLLALAALVLVAVAATGCATKGFVRTQVAEAQAATDARVGQLSGEVEAAKTRADQAYAKATLAEQLAAGELAYQEVSVHEVSFDFDDFRLDTDDEMVLNDLAGRLVSYPRYVIEVRGYADATGTDRYNYRLGRERAEAVQRYLAWKHNVPPGRIAILSFGEDDPAADNGSADGRAQNRRVRARLLDVKPKAGETPVASATD